MFQKENGQCVLGHGGSTAGQKPARVKVPDEGQRLRANQALSYPLAREANLRETETILTAE